MSGASALQKFGLVLDTYLKLSITFHQMKQSEMPLFPTSKSLIASAAVNVALKNNEGPRTLKTAICRHIDGWAIFTLKMDRPNPSEYNQFLHRNYGAVFFVPRYSELLLLYAFLNEFS